jgi:hypothetical protein
VKVNYALPVGSERVYSRTTARGTYYVVHHPGRTLQPYTVWFIDEVHQFCTSLNDAIAWIDTNTPHAFYHEGDNWYDKSRAERNAKPR